MLANEKKEFLSLEELKEFLQTHQTQCWCVPKSECSLALDDDEQAVINLWGSQYPLRETAKQSLLARYNVGGKSFYKCSDKQFVDALGIFWEYFPKDATIMLCDDVVNSVNSAIYKHIPLQEIIEELELVIAPFYDDKLNCHIEYDYSKCRIVFKTDKKFSFGGKEENLVITLLDSECGDSSVRFGAYIGRYMAPIMNDITVIHTGEADIDKVHNAIAGLETVVSQNFVAVKVLEKIKIDSPLTATKAIGSFAGFPEKYREAAASKMYFLDDSKVTAADIFMTYAQVICESDVTEECKERHRNNLLKMIKADWTPYTAKKSNVSTIAQANSTVSQQSASAVATFLRLF